MRKLLLGIILSLCIIPLASASQSSEVTLYQETADSESKELLIDLPSDISPGFKALKVSISGSSDGDVSEVVYFCKDVAGNISWRNFCPNLASQRMKNEIQFVPYDPIKNPRQTTNTAIIAFAVLGAITGASAIAKKNPVSTSSNGPENVNQPGYLAQLSKGGVLVASTKLGRGDRKNIWRRPINKKIDRFVSNVGTQVSGFSPLSTRVLSDGNYLRSLIGPVSLLLYPASISVGILASRSLHQEALPPSLSYILAMMIVGILDAFAGILLSSAFVMSVMLGGHFNSLNSILTVAGICLLAFSPALLAGAFRPFRRVVWDFTSLWERMTDYLLASILTGWVVQQIVLGLPGLSGYQLSITKNAREIALFAVVLIILRFALEDFSIRLFPLRLSVLEPEYRVRSILQQIIALIFKVSIFGLVAGRFVGLSLELLIGVILFSIPLIMGVFEDRFPKSEMVQKWMPTGVIEMLVMTISGYVIALLVQTRYPNARSYILMSFIFLSLPGFILKILALFGKEGAQDWRITRFGVLAYRFLGVIALGLLIYIILSGLLISNNV